MKQHYKMMLSDGLNLLTACLLLVFLVSCETIVKSKVKPITVSPPAATTENVHVVYEDCSGTLGCDLKLLSRGTVTTLIDGAVDEFMGGAYIKVVGSDQYVVANVNPGYIGKNQISIWKNGVPTSLTDETHSAFAYGFFVSESDVYVYGQQVDDSGNTIARYWKNGVPTSLTDGTHGQAMITQMQIVNGKSICLGVEDKTIKLWINGAANQITDGAHYANTKGMEIIESDIYIFGEDGSNTGVKVWKNGVVQNQTTSDYWYWYGSASSNGNLYAVAIDSFTFGSGVWMNGLFVDLITSDGSGSLVVTKAVRAFGDNLYVIGWKRDSAGDEVASYWKDGVEVSVSTNAGTYAWDLAISK